MNTALRRTVFLLIGLGDSTGTDFAKEVIRQFELDPSLAEMDNASAAVIIATLQAYRCP